MNKQELRGAFSKVQAPDGLLDTVCALEKEQKPRPGVWMIVRRVAAVAAVLAIVLTAMLWPAQEENYITAPGLLTVRAHATDSSGDTTIESEILEEGVTFTPNVTYNPTHSYRQHFPFSFSVDESLYPNMNITLEISTDAGIFYKNEPYDPDSPMFAPDTPAIMQVFLQYYGQHFTVDIDKAVYWEPDGFDYDYMEAQIKQGNLDFNSAYKDYDFEESPAYMDVIIRADEYIVGYCVIEICEIKRETDSHARSFSFEVLTIVSFPKVDGDWQHITEAYVAEQLKQIHERVQY